MGKVTRRELLPGETFFGGGSGTIIPFRPKATESSTKNLKDAQPKPEISQEFLDQIAQEAREQWGFPPEEDEIDPSKDDALK